MRSSLSRMSPKLLIRHRMASTTLSSLFHLRMLIKSHRRELWWQANQSKSRTGQYSMSNELVNRSSDLKRLRDEGYSIQISKSGYLVVRDVPYVNSGREVRSGILVSKLKMANDVTTTPDTHVVFFAGEHPCHKDGNKMGQIAHGSSTQRLDDIEVHHSFSNRPPEGYRDYYELITTYIGVISSPARSLNPKVTAQTFSVIETSDEKSVF